MSRLCVVYDYRDEFLYYCKEAYVEGERITLNKPILCHTKNNGDMIKSRAERIILPLQSIKMSTYQEMFTSEGMKDVASNPNLVSPQIKKAYDILYKGVES